MQIIRRYEKRKRDADPGIAIYGTLRLHAEKRSISEGESVPVTIRLVDCDEVPLGSRTVSLRAEGGSCPTEAVETDDRGEATVVFMAADASGWSSLYAEYLYDYPHGWGSVVASDEVIFAVSQDAEGACLVECPVEAIYHEDDVPDRWKAYIELNREMVETSPGITEQKPPLCSR